jgi:streptogrisin C
MDLIRTSGVDPATVRIEISTNQPQYVQDPIVGGWPYVMETLLGICSIGFPTDPIGFFTAGHCALNGVGTQVTGFNGITLGVFYAVDHGPQDMAWVAVTNQDRWIAVPIVDTYQQGSLLGVSGSRDVQVNATVCKSGYSTGYTCGLVEALNQTIDVVDPGGGPTVRQTNMVRSSTCVRGGDSGGAVMNNTWGVGIASAGLILDPQAPCGSSLETMWHQPLNPVLQRYSGVELLTVG